MKGLAVLLGALAVASAVWATIAAYRIGAWLSRHGVEVNWFWYRVTMPWYIHRYRKMTTESDGRVGSLYLHFLFAINAALLFAVATILLVVAGK